MRVVSFCVPKCANTSIKRAFMDIMGKTGNPHGRGQFKTISKWTAAYKYKKYFKFAFVRNPYSRIVSCYKNKIKGERFHSAFSRFGMTPNTTFPQFLATIVKYPDFLSDQHFRSQFYELVITDDVKKPLAVPDFIGRIENIEADWEHVRKEIYNLSGYQLPKLPHENRDRAGGKPWQDYYNDNLRKIVQRRYKNDFEAFGYDY